MYVIGCDLRTRRHPACDVKIREMDVQGIQRVPDFVRGADRHKRQRGQLSLWIVSSVERRVSETSRRITAYPSISGSPACPRLVPG